MIEKVKPPTWQPPPCSVQLLAHILTLYTNTHSKNYKK